MLFFFTIHLPRLKADPFLLGSGEVLPGIRDAKASSPKVRAKLLNVHLLYLPVYKSTPHFGAKK